MQTQICRAVVAAALVAIGGAASAQTVITRDPVYGDTVIRQPLQLVPTQRTTINRTIVPRDRRSPIVRERIVTETVAKAPAVAEEPLAVEPVLPAAPLAVEPAYAPRVIEAESVVPVPPVRRVVTVPVVETERVVTVPVVRERVVRTAPVVTERIVEVPRATRTTTRTVRTRTVVRQPALSGEADLALASAATNRYRYMVVNNRLLLVDSATGTVIEEIQQ